MFKGCPYCVGTKQVLDENGVSASLNEPNCSVKLLKCNILLIFLIKFSIKSV